MTDCTIDKVSNCDYLNINGKNIINNNVEINNISRLDIESTINKCFINNSITTNIFSSINELVMGEKCDILLFTPQKIKNIKNGLMKSKLI